MILSPTGIEVWSTRPVDSKRPAQVNTYTKFPNTSWIAAWVNDFVTAVRSGKEPPVSCCEGCENLAFITSSYDSMERGTPVQVPGYETRREAARV